MAYAPQQYILCGPLWLKIFVLGYAVVSGGLDERIGGYVLGLLSGSQQTPVALGYLDGEGGVRFIGFGRSDLLGLKPVGERTLFGVGSVTKSFTALSVLLLEEEGRLGLEDPVSDHLPELGFLGRSVLVEHLLTHTSGMPSLGVAEAIIGGALGGSGGIRPEGWAEFVGLVGRGLSERVFGPGERFIYWNEGYTILGELVARTCGRSFREFVRAGVLEPLGMVRTGFGASMFSDPDAAEPRILEGGRPVRARFPDHPLLDAAGGLVSCAVDLTRYVSAYLEGDVAGGLRGLLAKVWRPRVKCSLPSPFGEEYYGYGWAVCVDFLGHTLVHHSGNVGVHSAYVGFIPERRVGVVVLSGGGDVRVDYVGGYVLALLLGAEPERLGFVRYQRYAERLVGEYLNFAGTVRMSVKRVGPILYATFRSGEGANTFPLLLDGERLYLAVGVERIPVEVLGEGDLLVERNRFRRLGQR